MQIDFHHGATYVVARIAGFSPEQAQVIAHSAQYIDDATKEGVIKFDNFSMFRCMASAHKSIDYRNFEALKIILYADSFSLSTRKSNPLMTLKFQTLFKGLSVVPIVR